MATTKTKKTKDKKDKEKEKVNFNKLRYFIWCSLYCTSLVI